MLLKIKVVTIPVRFPRQLWVQMFCPIGLRHHGNIPGILTVFWKLNFLIYLDIVPNLKSDPSTQLLVKTIYSKFSCLVRTFIFFPFLQQGEREQKAVQPLGSHLLLFHKRADVHILWPSNSTSRNKRWRNTCMFAPIHTYQECSL